MNATAPLDLGVDVSKARLTIACFGELRPLCEIDNTHAAICKWLKSLPPGCRIGLEATGSYHEQLANLAVAAGHTVFVLNPRQVARYLKSLRARGKTDVLDAQGIARFVHNESDQCHPYVPPTPAQQALAQLIQRHGLLVKQRAALRMSFAGLSLCTRPLAKLVAAFDTLIADIDRQMHALIKRDAYLAEQHQHLDSICGFGPLVSAAMCSRLSRQPYPNSDAVVAALGFDPRPRDSGTFVGRRKLSKHGNPEERRLLFMAARSACHNRLWKARLQQLLARGLPSTAAYCVIARQLLRIAFAIWNNGSTYDPTRRQHACAGT